jgi:hypothetical protein
MIIRLAYETSSSVVVHTIRMRSACVGGVKSVRQVGVCITWGSTLVLILSSAPDRKGLLLGMLRGGSN